MKRKRYVVVAVCVVATAGLIWWVAAGRKGGGPNRAVVPTKLDTFRRSSGDRVAYSIYEPPGASPHAKYPLVVFLHAHGEKGSDGILPVTRQGIGPAISRAPIPFDFFVLFPQSRTGFWNAGSDDNRLAAELTDHVCKTRPIDPDRVYLTGFSTGGTGVWTVAAETPDQWAALAPVAAGAHIESVGAVRRLPAWCFHGADDKFTPPAVPKKMVAALKAAGANVKYTEFPKQGHDICKDVFLKPDVYHWLMQQKRPGT